MACGADLAPTVVKAARAAFGEQAIRRLARDPRWTTWLAVTPRAEARSRSISTVIWGLEIWRSLLTSVRPGMVCTRFSNASAERYSSAMLVPCSVYW